MKTQMYRMISGVLITSLSVLVSCRPSEDEIAGCDGCESGSGSGNLSLACLPPNLQTGLIAWYPFSGGSLQDETQNNHNLTNPGAAFPSVDRNGNPSCAYEFGDTDYLEAIDPGFMNGLGSFSISLWYYTFSNQYDDFTWLVSRDTISDDCHQTGDSWYVALYDCRQPLFHHQQSVIWMPLNPAGSTCESLIDSLDNQWHHLVVTNNAGQTNIWLDGNQTTDSQGFFSCNQGFAQTLDNLIFAYHLNGRLDDIAIYDRALAPQEIAELWQLEPCCGPMP